MPEGPEVDLDKVRETIDEEIDHQGSGPMLRWISLTTALLAALAAVASLRAGATVNEALLLKTEATQLQAEASDSWAFYQAKGIKAAVARADIDTWSAAGKTAPAAVAASAARYVTEQDSIRRGAEAKEHERDVRNHQADHLLEQHHRFAYAVAFFQIAIALGAVAALTRVRLVWVGSLFLGAAGLLLFASRLLG
jgi:hypothetical protein